MRSPAAKNAIARQIKPSTIGDDAKRRAVAKDRRREDKIA